MSKNTHKMFLQPSGAKAMALSPTFRIACSVDFVCFTGDWVSSILASPLATELSPASTPLSSLLCLVSNSISRKIHPASPAVPAVAVACCSTSRYSPLLPGKLVSASKCIIRAYIPPQSALDSCRFMPAASIAGDRQHLAWAPLLVMQLPLAQQIACAPQPVE